ncbi:MAG: FkbM family methyltransferase [Shimia sp.]
MALSPRHRAQLALHGALARLGVDGLRPVALAPEGDAWRLTTEGRTLTVPDPLIWRSYRRGWAARLDRLADEYGWRHLPMPAPGETVVDVGANVGDFARLASDHGCIVFAFDGDPAVVACLRANLADAPAVTATEAILWKRAEDVTFHSAPGRADSSLFLPPGDGVAAFTARATTLDAEAARLGIGPVAFLKMDAEGAEPEVLEGATDLLARTRALAIDTGPERLGQTTDAAVTDLLVRAGFDVRPHPDGRRNVTFATRESADA